MIVIEGADCVGKTTFCHSLIDALHDYTDKCTIPVYQHLSRLPDGVDYWEAHLAMIGRGLVRDRFHMSEVVYATALNRKHKMEPLLYEIIDAKIALLGGMVVVITADDEIITDRYEKGVKAGRLEFFSLEQVLDINERYRAIATTGFERPELLPGRTFYDKDPEPRFVGSDYKDHGVRFRVDEKVHLSYTNSQYEFEQGVERVAKRYALRQYMIHRDAVREYLQGHG